MVITVHVSICLPLAFTSSSDKDDGHVDSCLGAGHRHIVDLAELAYSLQRHLDLAVHRCHSLILRQNMSCYLLA